MPLINKQKRNFSKIPLICGPVKLLLFFSGYVMGKDFFHVKGKMPEIKKDNLFVSVSGYKTDRIRVHFVFISQFVIRWSALQNFLCDIVDSRGNDPGICQHSPIKRTPFRIKKRSQLFRRKKMLLIVGRTSSSGTFHRNAAKEYNADRDAYSSRYQQSLFFHFIIFPAGRPGVLFLFPPAR